MVEENCCIAVYDQQTKAVMALHQLLDKEFNPRKISMIGRGGQYIEQHPIGVYSTGDHISFLAEPGSIWDNIWKLLPDVAIFWLPHIGTVVIAGSLVDVFISTLKDEDQLSKMKLLESSLGSIGIPGSHIMGYESAIKSGEYLLVFHGNQFEVELAYDLLATGETNGATIHFG